MPEPSRTHDAGPNQRTVHVVPADNLTAAQRREIAALDKLLARLDEHRARAHADPQWSFDEPLEVFLRRMRLLTPQSYGARLQNRLAHELGWERVPASLDRGDVVDAAGDHHEVKVTYITGSNRSANFVQIRPHQDIAGYHLFIIDEDYRLTHLWLSKAQMAAELTTLGTCAHGTRPAVAANATVEWAVRVDWTPDVPRSHAARWIRTYALA